MNGERKSTGDRLKLDEVNALLDATRGSTAPAGLTDGGRTHTRQQNLSRPRLVECMATEAIQPYSIFAAADTATSVTIAAKSRRVLLKVGPLNGQRCSPVLLCTEETPLPANKQGHCRPVTPWEPTLVRVTDTEADQPAVGDFCGVVRSGYVVSKRYGGMICVASGLEVNISGTAKKMVAVVPCPDVWFWGKITATSGLDWKVRIDTSLAYGVGNVAGSVVLDPVKAPAFMTGLAVDAIVEVKYDAFSGRWAINNVVGCGPFPDLPE